MAQILVFLLKPCIFLERIKKTLSFRNFANFFLTASDTVFDDLLAGSLK